MSSIKVCAYLVFWLQNNFFIWIIYTKENYNLGLMLRYSLNKKISFHPQFIIGMKEWWRFLIRQLLDISLQTLNQIRATALCNLIRNVFGRNCAANLIVLWQIIVFNHFSRNKRNSIISWITGKLFDTFPETLPRWCSSTSIFHFSSMSRDFFSRDVYLRRYCPAPDDDGTRPYLSQLLSSCND